MIKTIEVIKPIKITDSSESNSSKKKRVAAFARVSTDDEDQINSYKNQCENYTKTITANPNYIYVGLFADPGISGTQAKKRPQFMKLIQSARNGEIDLILTKSISRFARNTVDTLTIVRELRVLGVEIFFEKENLSSLDSNCDFLLTILASIAQEESRSISTNVKWSIEKNCKNGIVNSRRLYGYLIEDGKMVIHKDEAKVIKQIFTLALKGYNINDIVKTLNNEGYQTLKGMPWRYGTVRHILQNEKYCGDALLRKTVCIDYLTKKTVKNDNICNKYYVSNNHEPIVTKETFEAVNFIINNQKHLLRNNGKSSKYPLTGILYCPRCGRSLKRQQIRNGKNLTVILNCNHSYNNNFICKGGSPKYDLVVGSAIESIRQILVDKDLLNNLFKVFDNNVALNTFRSKRNQLKEDNLSLHQLYNENPTDEEVLNQILSNDELIKNFENSIHEGLSSSVHLHYIKSIVADEHFNEQKIILKDIYSLVIADEQKVRFVISPNKDIYQLINQIPSIIVTNPILCDIFYSEDQKSGIFYEVIIYE